MISTGRHLVWIGIALVIGAALAIYVLPDRNEQLVTPDSPKSIWNPTTQAFRTNCEGGGCNELGTINLAHVGETRVYEQPDVDDEVRQWAGCLDSALSCFAGELSSDCVANSLCPTECKEKYAEVTATVNAPMDYLVEFESLFIVEDGYCRPQLQ